MGKDKIMLQFTTVPIHATFKINIAYFIVLYDKICREIVYIGVGCVQ